MDILLLAIGILILFIYALCVIFVWKSKKAKKYNLSLSLGIFIMWRTEKGKKLLDRLAKPKRFWKWYGNVAIGIILVCGILMMVAVVYTSIYITYIPAASKPKPQMLLGLPGINPIIPIWYGILALAIAMVLHEFAHGILSRVANLNVKSLGILFLIVPIGAFTEPDEEELFKTGKRKRVRVFAVGPATNILLAIICALIFSWSMMSSLQPAMEGVLIIGHSNDSELSKYGSDLGMAITSLNNTQIKTIDDFNKFAAPDPTSNVSVNISYNGEKQTVEAVSGVIIATVYSGTPADKAGLKNGTVLYTVNGVTIRNNNDFTTVMTATHTGEVINITVYSRVNSNYKIIAKNNITLVNKYDYSGVDSDKGIGFLGVSAVYLGVYVDSIGALSGELAHPLAGPKTYSNLLNGIRFYISLPIIRLSPFPQAFTSIYTPTGFWAGVPSGSFWIIANCLYWLFWLNLMLGLTNALPAIPFDGGYVLKDFLDMVATRTRPKMNKDKRDKYVNSTTWIISLVFIAMILWLFVATVI